MSNIKVCSKCGKVGLDQYDFYIQWDGRRDKYYYSVICLECKYKYNVEFRENNIKKYKKCKKQYRKNHKNIIKEYNKMYRESHKEYFKEYQRNWFRNNPDKAREYHRKRYALRKNAEGSYTIEDLKYIYNHQQGRCPSCKEFISFDDMTVDHIVPLSWGGSNYPSNIQLLCSKCNSSKNNYHDTDFRDYVPLFLK